MRPKPRVLVLKTDGTNCDEETSHAFNKADGECRTLHVTQLRENPKLFRDFQILAISGGFSYGDDVKSGKILAVELLSFFRDSLLEFTAAHKPILGICNGFQGLVRTGLLPFGELGNQSATLADNDTGVFGCKWVGLRGERSRCVFTRGLEGEEFQLQMAHGEGKFLADPKELALIEEQHLAPLRYTNNPNGSLNNIAGVCDPTGLIFGLMPHPERFVDVTQHPNWRRERQEPIGRVIFENAVDYAAHSV